MNSQLNNSKNVKSQSTHQQQEWFMKLLANDDADLSANMDWLDQLRNEARLIIKTMPELNRKQEAWRYDRVDSIFKKSFDPHMADDVDIQKPDIDDYQLPLTDGCRLVFVNGCFEADLSDLHALPQGVTLTSIDIANHKIPEHMAQWFNDTCQHNEHVFNMLNSAMFNDGVYLHVDRSIQIDRTIEIIYLNKNRSQSAEHYGSMIQTRNIIDLDIGASAKLVEYFIGSNDYEKYFHNNVTEINLADRARLGHKRVQMESPNAYHMSSVYVSQKKNSKYNNIHVALGSGWSKTECNVNLIAQQAECDIQGLYMVGDQQLTDFHLDVQHLVPSCRSREKFKGILYGKGRAVFDGRILVDRQAQHSNASLTNDNLILVRDAEVDTKPQLEIYADDVKCSHGTTIGRLDPQQLFYLRSRGIAEDDARKILCQAFASDIIDSIDHAGVRDFVGRKISNTLNKSKLLMADENDGN